MKKLTACIVVFALCLQILYLQSVVFAETLSLQKGDVINKMELVNDYWLNNNPDAGWVDWARSVYFEGNMSMYRVYPKQNYYDFAVTWGTNNSWGLCSTTTGGNLRNADNQCVGQTYAELYQYSHNDASPKVDDWTWIDAIQMAMPTFAKLGVIKNDTRYFGKMYQLYSYTKNTCDNVGLYAGNGKTYTGFGPKLWWRDGNYNPGSAKATSPNGKQVFWSRGNGWVFAALARVLDVLPTSDSHYNEYLQDFKDMAGEIKSRQIDNGFWYSNLDDPNDCAGPEVSGTSMFTYGVAWGINKGVLNKDEYLPSAIKAWNAMINTAVHPNGFLGYVQTVAAAPGVTTYDTTADFGVGCFLLAGSELVKLAEGTMPEVKCNHTIVSVSASSFQTGNPPQNAIDNNYSTRWAASGEQWIKFDLGAIKRVAGVNIAFLNGNTRKGIFDIYVSVDGTQWEQVFSGMSSGTTDRLESYTFSEKNARYIRINGHGNTSTDPVSSVWNSILEATVVGYR